MFCDAQRPEVEEFLQKAWNRFIATYLCEIERRYLGKRVVILDAHWADSREVIAKKGDQGVVEAVNYQNNPRIVCVKLDVERHIDQYWLLVDDEVKPLSEMQQKGT